MALEDDLFIYRDDPFAMQSVVLNAYDSDVPNATSPFAFMVEATVALANTAYMAMETINRQRYPEFAATEEELYLHMSYEDYIGRFGSPSRGQIHFYISIDEFRAKAVAVGNTGIRKIVIPRDTEFKIQDTVFTMAYPIEMRIMPHGGIQVVYDTSVTNPLTELSSNVVDWDTAMLGGVVHVRLKLTLDQVKVTRTTTAVNNSGSFNATVTFSDNYYYTRVYVLSDANVWNEIRTTHTDQVYDSNYATAVLKVVDNTVKVHIPPIYLTNQLVKNKIRIDVYATKGPLVISLGEYQANEISAVFIDADDNAPTLYTDPLKTIGSMTPFGIGKTSGGSDPLSFEDLRSRVILNASGRTVLPITKAQLEASIADKGYSVVPFIDDLTQRIYLATKPLPDSNINGMTAGASAAMRTVSIKMTDLVDMSTVMNNGDRLTLLPSTLYKDANGIMSVVDDFTRNSLSALTKEALAAALNGTKYLFTPFHYVLDVTSNNFVIRPYYLESPYIDSKLFVMENETVALQVEVGSYDIIRTASGYQILIVTSSGDGFKAMDDANIVVQLSYTAEGEDVPAYLNATLVGTDPVLNERMYRFDITTNYDVDELDRIYLTSFKMFDATVNRELPTLFAQAMTVTFIALNQTSVGIQPSAIDNNIGGFLLPDNVPYVGIVQEKLNVVLGYSLTNLWANATSKDTDILYEQWDVDVPYIYDAPQFELNNDGSYKVVDLGSGPQLNKIADAGDPKLDEVTGDPVMRYYAGDYKRDAGGNLIPINAREVARNLDLLVVDGRFLFADTDELIAYRKTFAETIVDWVVNDLKTLTVALLDETKLLFYALRRTGTVEVIVDGSLRTSMESEQSFALIVYLTKQAYSSPNLRNEMSLTIRSVLNTAMNSRTVSTSELIDRLKLVLGDDVIGINITGLGDDKTYSAVTTINDAQRLSIRRIAEVTEDNHLTIRDDIDITFKIHSLDA